MHCIEQTPIRYKSFEIRVTQARNTILLQIGRRRLQFCNNQFTVLEQGLLGQYLIGMALDWDLKNQTSVQNSHLPTEWLWQ